MNKESILKILTTTTQVVRIAIGLAIIKKASSISPTANIIVVEGESHAYAEYPIEKIDLAVERFLWIATSHKSEYRHELHEEFLED